MTKESTDRTDMNLLQRNNNSSILQHEPSSVISMMGINVVEVVGIFACRAVCGALAAPLGWNPKGDG